MLIFLFCPNISAKQDVFQETFSHIKLLSGSDFEDVPTCDYLRRSPVENPSSGMRSRAAPSLLTCPGSDGRCVTSLRRAAAPGVRRRSGVARSASCALSSGWRSGRSQSTVLLRDGGENLGRINRRNTWSTFSGSGARRAIGVLSLVSSRCRIPWPSRVRRAPCGLFVYSFGERLVRSGFYG